MKRKLYTFLFTSLIISCLVWTVQAQDLPPCFENTDIGDVAATGDAYLEDDSLIVSGSGADIWETADAFHYAYRPAQFDCEITAYVSNVTVTAPDAKACLMIRETLEPDSRFASALVTAELGTYFQWRAIAGETCGHLNLDHSQGQPVWLKLKRVGNIFTAQFSLDGETWLPETDQTTEIEMADEVYIGLAVTAHNNDGSLCDATFSALEIDAGIECETSINLPSAEVISVYPNPVSDILTLDIAEKALGTNSMIFLHNTRGQLVLKAEVTGSSHSIDLSDLPTGLYYATLRTDREDIVKKIVKK
jgi:hypothetical protein